MKTQNTQKEKEKLLRNRLKVLIFTSQLSKKNLSNILFDPGQKNERQNRTLNSLFFTSTNEAEISQVILKLKKKH